jgi:hypothetical protein
MLKWSAPSIGKSLPGHASGGSHFVKLDRIENQRRQLGRAESLKKVAAEARLEEPHEISAPIRAHPISSIPWIICLRSGATELSKRRPLAVF